MNGLCLIFVCVSSIAIIFVPRRWVALPFLAGACYTTYGQGVDLGPLTFYVVRLLILAGFVRIVVRGERLDQGLNRLDWLVVAWAAIAIVSSAGHEKPASALVFRLGVVYDYVGIYFMGRFCIRSTDDARFIIRILAWILVPVALEMMSERLTGQNRFAILGGVPEACFVREGKVRAQCPFMHPILAGTVGAVCLPLIASLWKTNRKLAAIGIVASALMVLSSGSSGPMMSAIFAAGALTFWHYREYLRVTRWALLAMYLVLNAFMKVPAYYLLARLDLAGGSTGWHRAELINSAIKHLNEWWLVGTDYTRHWMPAAGGWNPNHSDITNQYILIGTWGGLPLMLCFIGIITLGFVYVGRTVRNESLPAGEKFFVWALGASLFANAATCISVAFFDQSFLFLYLVLGAIGSLAPVLSSASSEAQSGELELSPNFAS